MSSEILKKQNKGNSSILKLILVMLLFLLVILSAIIFGQKGNRQTTTTVPESDVTETTSVLSTSQSTKATETESTKADVTETTSLTETETVTETTVTETTATETETTTEETTVNPIVEKIQVNLIVVNKYSRPGTKLDSVKWIIIHYVANPGTTAMQNRNYFNGLATSHKASASAHFVIGLDGEIVQCLPLDEVSYNAGSAAYNNNSISIECCHPDSTGKFKEETYESLVELVSWLCERYGLDTDDVIRHYDVTGKDCPKYWAGKVGTEQYARWQDFIDDVKKNLK